MAVTKAGKELNSNDPESLKKLRLFCLELSSFAISFREQVFQGDSFEQCAL